MNCQNTFDLIIRFAKFFMCGLSNGYDQSYDPNIRFWSDHTTCAILYVRSVKWLWSIIRSQHTILIRSYDLRDSFCAVCQMVILFQLRLASLCVVCQSIIRFWYDHTTCAILYWRSVEFLSYSFQLWLAILYNHYMCGLFCWSFWSDHIHAYNFQSHAGDFRFQTYDFNHAIQYVISSYDFNHAIQYQNM